MKKKYYIIYCIITAVLLITLPLGLIFLNRTYQFSDAEIGSLAMPTVMLLFCALVGVGVLAERIKD